MGHQPGLHRAGDARAGLDGRRCSACQRSSSRRRQRGRRDPGFGLERHAVRAAGGARTGDRAGIQRARLRRAAGGLHLDPGAFVGREGGQDRRAGTGRTCGSSRWTSALRMRPDRLREQIAQDREAGLHAVLCVAPRSGTTSSNAFDPLPEIGAICREDGSLAARGRRDGGHGGPVPRVPPLFARTGAGRQLLLQPAQVDVHQLRLRLLLRGRPGRR